MKVDKVDIQKDQEKLLDMIIYYKDLRYICNQKMSLIYAKYTTDEYGCLCEGCDKIFENEITEEDRNLYEEIGKYERSLCTLLESLNEAEAKLDRLSRLFK